MSHYRQLFDLQIHHRYFAHGTGGDMDVVPTEATRRLLQATGLLWRSAPGSLGVLFNSDDTDTLISRIKDSSEELKLCFCLVSRDPAFSCYSDLQPAGDDSVYCFNNWTHQPNADGVTLLHSGDHVSSSDLVQRDSMLAQGYFSSDTLRNPLCLTLIIDIDNSFLDKGRGLVCNQYRLDINARKTYWKYYLLHGFADRDLIIKHQSNNGETAFVDEGRQVLSNNQSARVFRTESPLQLQDRYGWQFQLRERTDTGEKILLKRLPLAGAGRLHREEIDGKPEFVSEIYVNC